MDRREEMQLFAQELFRPRLQKRFECVDQLFNTPGNELRKAYYAEVAHLVELAQNRQAYGDVSLAHYFSISYLYSSVITKTYEFQLSIMNERCYIDDNACAIYWSPAIIFQPIEEDMKLFEQAARGKWIRVTQFELDEIRQYLAREYYGLAGLFFVRETPQAVLDAGITALRLGEELKLVYSGFMDQGIAFAVIKGGALQ